ncbi:MAG TPA: uracil-DNA glycosylase [Planctomycetota bacterium]|nr:uracil-DNA glycosylase [Planctomycetota bacterium]
MPRTSTSTAGRKHAWKQLESEMEACRACPRLVRWREEVSKVKRREHRDADYWGKPVLPFGPRDAPILLLGLAPGAHGANRTGRPFTGDGAGPFLYGALHRAGLSSGPVSSARDDELELRGVRISNAVRCVPPGNKPTPAETSRCSPFLDRELDLLTELRVILCLGEIAWRAAHAALARRVPAPPPRRERFGHGAVQKVGEIWMVGSYHPSQLNTRTGRLTQTMFDTVIGRASLLARN